MNGVAGGAFSHAGPPSLGQVADNRSRNGRISPHITARITIPTLHSAAVAILLLSGCASTMPETVMVPVPVPCIDAMPQKPAMYADADLLKLPDADFIIALGIDRQVRVKYIGELEALMLACVK